MNPDQFETYLSQLSKEEIIEYMQLNYFLKKEILCDQCNLTLKMTKFVGVKDEFSFRCMNNKCRLYKKRTSIRKFSFFENINIDLLSIFKVIIGWCVDQPIHSIKKKLQLHPTTIRKIIGKLIDRIGTVDFSDNKLGGPKQIIQIDETMLNFRCKSHRGRSPQNRTDALCIIEYDGKITRAFAKVIANKEANTILPIIFSQVQPFSKIHTDEHRSYSKLSTLGYDHDTVCHKYNFVDKNTGTNTQGVESFNNELKLEIKRRKGIETNLRQRFLDEFCFKFNTKKFRLEKVLNLTKILRSFLAVLEI
ncbi:hypothetical protein H311_02327 [Anncaliia algerae PRA109]|nr:hypothetical protein H311_02327 [Anncaliia algerae PRA109]